MDNRQFLILLLFSVGILLFGCFNLIGLFTVLQIVEVGSILYDSIMVRIILYSAGSALGIFTLLYLLWKVKESRD